MKNTKYDLSTVEGLTKAVIEGIEEAVTLEEALELAKATETHFKGMSSKDRELTLSNLKDHAKKGLEKLIKEDMVKRARDLASNLEANISDEEIEEIVSKITKDKLEEIANEMVEEELNDLSNTKRKSIMATENEDMVLLVPSFLPDMEEIPKILSEIREDFGKGLKGVVAQDKIVVLEYSDRKDIVFGIEDEFLKEIKLEEYAKQIFDTLEDFVKIDKVFTSIEDKFEKFMQMAKNR